MPQTYVRNGRLVIADIKIVKGGVQHLANTFVDIGVRRQGGHLGASQLGHPELALLRGLLCSDEGDLLLRSDRLRLNLPQQLMKGL